MGFLGKIAALKPIPGGEAARVYTATLGIALDHKVLLPEMNRTERGNPAEPFRPSPARMELRAVQTRRIV